MVGESGLQSHNRRIRFTPGGKFGDLIWPNGTVGNLFGAYTPEDVERLRGPQYCLLWYEELAAWRYLEECYDQSQFGLRLGPHPHAVASTTPKPRPFLVGSPNVQGLLNRDTTVTTTATTDDNPFLAERVRAELYRRYGGTRIGRQELLAQILTDVPGALWKREMIQYGVVPQRWAIEPGGKVLVDDYGRVVVAVDPAVTYGPDSDETGIVVGGVRGDLGFVIDDLSGRFSPHDWARRVVSAYHTHRADSVVAESNNGGELVRLNILAVDPTVPVRLVSASRGKVTRAEPVASLYEQGRVFHVRAFPELEDQLCTYTKESAVSPDRLDAMVWALTDLMLGSAFAGKAEDFSVVA